MLQSIIAGILFACVVISGGHTLGSLIGLKIDIEDPNDTCGQELLEVKRNRRLIKWAPLFYFVIFLALFIMINFVI